MSASHTLIVNELIRSPEAGPEDRLELSAGVNVLVGPPNTGKTKWLQMLDFILGNDDDAPSAFGEDVANKYTSILARLTVAGESWEVQRRWDDATPKSRVFLNDEAINVKQFLHRLLEQLAIPILHYPQGNPYGQRSWPELGWRSLYRHMYRRQLLWSDIADNQPESEQHACILQFTGLAKQLFSEEYGELVKKEKRIIELKAQKEQFMSVLSEVSKDLLSAEEIGVGITPQSLDAARQRIQSQIDELGQERQTLLAALSAKVKLQGDNKNESRSRLDELSEEMARLENRLQELQLAKERNRTRLTEMSEYDSSIEQELDRLMRAAKAGAVLADLKVTHCPVCDRPVSQATSQANCYLCHRPMDTNPSQDSILRLELEIEQTKAVVAEATKMVAVLEGDRQRIDAEVSEVQIRVREIRGLLRPVRTAAAAVLPREIGVIDMKVGQLQEQLSQVERVSKSLASRETLTQRIDEIQQESADLEQEVARQSAGLDFERASDSLQDGMNTYLNSIKKAAPQSWTQKEVRVRIDEKRARCLVGEQKKWSSQLGGTLTLYFLIAYHYALMNLTKDEACNFPGFLAIDFPAELPDGSSIKDTENFVIEPFVTLLASEGFSSCQVIAAGGAFEKLKGANRIEFSNVWA